MRNVLAKDTENDREAMLDWTKEGKNADTKLQCTAIETSIDVFFLSSNR